MSRFPFLPAVAVGVIIATAGLAAESPTAPAAEALLSSRYSADALAARFGDARVALFPPAKNREAWDRLLEHPLNRHRREWLIGEATKVVGQPWPELPATLYMEFARTGNRVNFEKPYFARRSRLATLVLAECFEHKGRFLDDIVNGVSAMLEESTWCIPAHVARLPGDALGRTDLQSVDLFAAETAMTLALVHAVLGDELREISPSLVDRIRTAVVTRVIEPVETSDDFGSAVWLTGINNWSPWCSSNVLGAAFLLIDDRPRLARLSVRLMRVVDAFLGRYGADGGCDEGPGYWNEAPGAMLVFLELLHTRTHGFVDVYREPKIAAMGEFIVTAHIAGPWFVNFADADARSGIDAGKVFRYGERTGSKPMQELALLAQRKWRPQGPIAPPLSISGTSRSLLGPLMELYWIPGDARPAGDVPVRRTVWLPDLQVLVARTDAVPERGLFLAAKAGHNAESHNHNDVGHGIVFLDGEPVVIDVGRETYTASTFGDRRYELWFTRGSGHNAPVVNGVEQAPGRSFSASSVHCDAEGEVVRLGMNLEGAYPAQARVARLRREWELVGGERPEVRLTDGYTFSGEPGTLALNFMVAREPALREPGRIVIECQPRPLVLEFDPERYTAHLSRIPLTDPIMQRNWGRQVWRIVLEHRATSLTGECQVRFAPAR